MPARRGPNIKYRPRRPVVPAGRGEKNNDRITVRNTQYKIKRIMLQPRYVELKHNGREVRRIVVRRHTLSKHEKKARILACLQKTQTFTNII